MDRVNSKLRATRLKDAVPKAHALSTSTPTWGSLCEERNDIYGLDPVRANIQSHGYIGDGTLSTPSRFICANLELFMQYYRRTKNKAGANRKLGIKAPGTQTDIAPLWVLDTQT